MHELLQQWNSVIGLRNRIVRDYMNIDMNLINELITNDRTGLLASFCVNQFLLRPNKAFNIPPSGGRIDAISTCRAFK